MSNELLLRFASGYENESSTLIDFLFWYMKAWKKLCQQELSCFSQNDSQVHREICNALGKIEMIAYDFAKGITLDCELARFKPSVIMAGLLSISIELYIKIDIN